MNTRWTYKVVEVKSNLLGHVKTATVQEALNQLGTQGWELVSVVQAGPADTLRLFLKKAA